MNLTEKDKLDISAIATILWAVSMEHQENKRKSNKAITRNFDFELSRWNSINTRGFFNQKEEFGCMVDNNSENRVWLFVWNF